jgi:hypothetical protein
VQGLTLAADMDSIALDAVCVFSDTSYMVLEVAGHQAASPVGGSDWSAVLPSMMAHTITVTEYGPDRLFVAMNEDLGSAHHPLVIVHA